jgi:hypothetical protein
MPDTILKPRLVPALVAGALLLLSGAGWAQDPAAPAAKPAASKRPPSAAAFAAQGTGAVVQDPKVTVERGAGGKKVYRITDALRIEGKIQKPEAFYVLQKSSINYDWQDLKQDFVPKIFESVTQAPF